MSKSYIFAIDFDGTIVTHDYPDIGKPVPLAIETIKNLIDNGHRFILYTMRSGEALSQAVKYCKDNGIEPWNVNKNPEQSTWTSSIKVYAHYYIDDAAVGTPLSDKIDYKFYKRPFVDWEKIRHIIKDHLIKQS
jgi:hydroxymethylpyrimidine pyrophosphatase-like HAD family hydrolase